MPSRLAIITTMPTTQAMLRMRYPHLFRSALLRRTMSIKSATSVMTIVAAKFLMSVKMSMKGIYRNPRAARMRRARFAGLFPPWPAWSYRAFTAFRIAISQRSSKSQLLSQSVPSTA
ncbi:MAG: hypothetical protein APF80_16120 [Alphaproteobacteria bacterium BRH_c36]|nr:MAG: hypothetical protein APF80_16120 [Alphaproteobacteria bacterium BRH_c36]